MQRGYWMALGMIACGAAALLRLPALAGEGGPASEPKLNVVAGPGKGIEWLGQALKLSEA